MIAGIVYQQRQFKVNTGVFLKTKICGEWLVYAEQVTYGCCAAVLNHMVDIAY